MEEPQYADINDAELREIESELGHPVTRELAQWFIRNRINREAVERMMETANPNRVDGDGQNVRSSKETRARKPVAVLNKVNKKCA